MNERIPLCIPWMGGAEFKMMKEAYDSGFVTPCGPMVDRFEKEIVAKMKIPYAGGVSCVGAPVCVPVSEMDSASGNCFF